MYHKLTTFTQYSLITLNNCITETGEHGPGLMNGHDDTVMSGRAISIAIDN